MSLWDYNVARGRARWAVAPGSVLPVHEPGGAPLQHEDFTAPEKDHFYFEWEWERAPWPVYLYIKDVRGVKSRWWNETPVRVVFDVDRSVTANVLDFVAAQGTIIIAECGLVQSRRRLTGVKRYAIDSVTPIFDLHHPVSRSKCYAYVAHATQSRIRFDTIFVTLSK